MRVFVQLRQMALSNTEVIQKLEAIKNKYDKQFSNIYEALDYLLKKDSQLVVSQLKIKSKFI